MIKIKKDELCFIMIVAIELCLILSAFLNYVASNTLIATIYNVGALVVIADWFIKRF